MKSLLILLAVLLTAPQLEAKELLVQTITGFTWIEICQEVEKDDIVVLDSLGGDVSMSILVADCINNAGASVRVSTALSAAMLTAMLSDKVCIDKDAIVGTHQPALADSPITRDIQQRFYGLMRKVLLYRQYSSLNTEIYVAMMDRAPSSSMNYVEPAVFRKLIGSRYIGECEIPAVSP